jgi:hypothetical protein
MVISSWILSRTVRTSQEPINQIKARDQVASNHRHMELDHVKLNQQLIMVDKH